MLTCEAAYVPAPDSHNRMSQRTASDDALRDTREVRPTPQAETLPKKNFDLNSFEAVMKAMDSELARAKAGKSAPLPSRDKGKGVEREVCSEADDIETAMDAELRAALGSEDIEEGEDIDRESPDYGLIKNFLESFKNQAGLPGPVSSLVGRLEPGWSLPRDS